MIDMGKTTITKYVCDSCNKELLPYSTDLPGIYILTTSNRYVLGFVTLSGKVLCDECFKKWLSQAELQPAFMDARIAEDMFNKMKEGWNESERGHTA